MVDAPSPLPGQASVASPETPTATPIVVKKYANRRLYNTETSSYITLDNLAEMIRAGRDFVVYDAKSGDDITRGVLTQIIVEEESKGSAMLPTAFLRQLIGFYGGNLQGVVPRYLEHTMSSFARQQQQVRQMMERTLSPFLPTGVEEVSRQNLAIFERALSMWNPFHRGDANADTTPVAEAVGSPLPAAGPAVAGPAVAGPEEVERLRHEIERLKQQLAEAHATSAPPAPASDHVAEPAASEPTHAAPAPEHVVQHATEHALAAVPIAPSAFGEAVPANAPANVLADPPPVAAGTNGTEKLPRRSAPRGKLPA